MTTAGTLGLMKTDSDDYLSEMESRLNGLKARAARLVDEFARGDSSAEEVDRVGKRLDEKVQTAEAKLEEVRQPGAVSAEERNELNVVCAELRVEVTALELEARQRSGDTL